MLRTVSPQASRVVTPASASRRSAAGRSWTLTKWNWMFWRVVMWPQPRLTGSATSPAASSMSAVSTPPTCLVRIMCTSRHVAMP